MLWVSSNERDRKRYDRNVKYKNITANFDMQYSTISRSDLSLAALKSKQLEGRDINNNVREALKTKTSEKLCQIRTKDINSCTT